MPAIPTNPKRYAPMNQRHDKIPMIRDNAGVVQHTKTLEDKRLLTQPPELKMQKLSPASFKMSVELVFSRLFEGREFKTDESSGITMVPGITRKT